VSDIGASSMKKISKRWLAQVDLPAGAKQPLGGGFVGRRSRRVTCVQLIFAATVVVLALWSFPRHETSILLSTGQDAAPPSQFEEPKHETEQVEAEHEKITVLTYSDRVTPGLCRSMVTAASHGFELHVLGVNEMTFSSFAGDPKMKKLFGMKALLSNETKLSELGLHNKSTIVFSDASDVIYLSQPNEIKEHVHALLKERGENVVLIAAERNCWPYMVKDREMMPGGNAKCAEFPSHNSTFRYLNSGAYIGRVESIKYMIASAYDRLSDAKDDQLALHEIYAEHLQKIRNGTDRKSTFDIMLDQRANIFQTG
jgi:hypothetical protein